MQRSIAAIKERVACKVSLPSSLLCTILLTKPRSLTTRGGRPNPRSRSNTVRSYTQNVESVEEAPVEVRPKIATSRNSRHTDHSSDYSPAPSMRPNYARATTFNDSPQPSRDLSPATRPGISRIPSDSLMIRTARSNLRSLDEQDVFGDDSGSYTNGSDRGYGDQSISPATSHGSEVTPFTSKKGGPPPPPPSRAKKPPPPPVPAKRSVLT